MTSPDVQWRRIGDLAVQVSADDVPRPPRRSPAGHRSAAVPRSEAVKWLAAYALGLAYSSVPDTEAVRLLLGAARRHQDLQDARLHLGGWTVVDTTPQQRALRLLAGAAEHHVSVDAVVGAD